MMLRGALLATLGGLITPLVCRGYDVEMPAARSSVSLQIAAFSLAVAGSGVGASVLRAEQAQAWMLDALGLGGGARAGAAAAAAGIAGGVLGIVHGALAAHGLGAGPGLGARLAVEGAVWGMALGAVGPWAARRAQVLGPRRDRVGAIRVLITVGLATGAVGLLGELSLVAAGGGAVVLTALAARKAADLEPPRSAHRHGDAT
ncbi:Membrane glycoprotein [Chondromyces apiculatus DSM 436]|uniref:Membrane glycoprotein n=1 Tax=Chondromyces apiculatus DSM 436 TaxID=1192034 RepID=A0A017T6D5_9BACT|nr:Membrane glycoprotein [Chondromyces apiculatus DSM 436]